MGQISTYLDDRSVQANNADTYRKVLATNQKITSIDIRVEITNGSSSGIQQIVDALTTINLVDGNTPIFSCFPRTVLAIDALIMAARVPQIRDEGANNVQELFLRIPFGRYQWDRDYWLDTSRWKAPEIRIPFAPTISSTRFATGTVTFTTILNQWVGDDAPGAAKGYFRWVEGLNRTSAASGANQNFLPLDKPILGVMVLSRVAGTAFQTDLSRIRILENVGGREIRNVRSEDGFSQNHESFHLEAIERGLALRQDNGVVDTDCNFLQSFHMTPILTQTTSTSLLVDTLKSVTGDEVNLSMIAVADSAGTIGAAALDTTNRNLRWVAEGRGLPHSIYVGLGDWNDPDTRYDFPDGSKPIIELTDAGSGADQHLTYLTLDTP